MASLPLYYFHLFIHSLFLLFPPFFQLLTKLRRHMRHGLHYWMDSPFRVYMCVQPFKSSSPPSTPTRIERELWRVEGTAAGQWTRHSHLFQQKNNRSSPIFLTTVKQISKSINKLQLYSKKKKKSVIDLKYDRSPEGSPDLNEAVNHWNESLFSTHTYIYLL
jgi:hypothetical protein